MCRAIFSLVRFGHAIQHYDISVEGQTNKSMTHQPLKCNTEFTVFISPMLQMVVGNQNTHGSLVIVEHM